MDEVAYVKLVVRPRWKRVLRSPRLVWLYLRAGCGLWMSIKMAWMAVTFVGRWSDERK